MKIEAHGAFFAPPSSLATAQDAYAIVRTPDDAVVLLLATALETEGEEETINPISGAVLKAMASEVSSAKGGPNSRIGSAFDAGRTALREQRDSSSLSCTALCAVLVSSQAYIGWLGAEEACLVRDSEIMARTEGHSWIRELREQGLLTIEEVLKRPRRVVTRSLIPGEGVPSETPELLTPDFLPRPWALRAGDAVLVATERLLERVRPGELSSVVSRRPPAEAVKALVERAAGEGVIAAVVARVAA